MLKTITVTALSAGGNLTIIWIRGVKLCCIIAGNVAQCPLTKINIDQTNFLAEEEREGAGGAATEVAQHNFKRAGEEC